MNRKRYGGQAAEISLSAAAIQRSVAVQDFFPRTLHGNAHAIVLSNDGCEITHEKNLVVRTGSAAEKTNDALFRVLAIHPLEPGGIKVRFMQRRLAAVYGIEIPHPP